MSFLGSVFGGSGSSPTQATQYVGGNADYANNQAKGLQAQGAAAQGRTAPTQGQTYGNTSGQAAGVGAAQGAAMGTAGQAGTYTAQGANTAGQVQGVGNTLQSLGENGAGSGLTGQAGNALMGIGTAAPGQSAADLAMKQQGDQSILAQAALAAGARGGNAQLANQNAAANAGQLAGQTQQNLGVQMAQEYAQNQALKTQALTQAGNIFQGQNALQSQNVNAAGNMFATGGGLLNQSAGLANQTGGLQVSAGNLGLGQEQTTSGQDQQAAALQAAQQQQNDTYQQNAQQLAFGQQDLNAQLAQQAASGNQQAQQATNSGNKALFGGIVSGLASGAGTVVGASDVRGKKNIKPAEDEIDDLFRNAGAHSYEYKDPSAPGTKPGRQFGPMAQELETTDAGKSAVIHDPEGRKYIDTPRLSLLMSSEVGRQRKQIDELAAAVFGRKKVA